MPPSELSRKVVRVIAHLRLRASYAAAAELPKCLPFVTLELLLSHSRFCSTPSGTLEFEEVIELVRKARICDG